MGSVRERKSSLIDPRTGRRCASRRETRWFDPDTNDQLSHGGVAPKKGALAFCRQLDSDQLNGRYLDPRKGEVTVAEFARLWVDGHPGKRQIINGYRHYIANHLLDPLRLPAEPGEPVRTLALGPMPLAELRPSLIRLWLRGLQATPSQRAEGTLAYTTVKQARIILHAICNTALADGIIAAEHLHLPLHLPAGHAHASTSGERRRVDGQGHPLNARECLGLLGNRRSRALWPAQAIRGEGSVALVIMNAEGLTPSSMRVARPVSQIPATLRFYVETLGLEHLGGFSGHDGYDGAFVGSARSDWHIEFTSHKSGMPSPNPTVEDLLVFYVSDDQLAAAARNLREAGFGLIQHENPYWARSGAAVCRDPDGYLVVLCPQSG